MADWRAHLVEVQRRKNAGEPPLKSIEEYRAEEHVRQLFRAARTIRRRRRKARRRWRWPVYRIRGQMTNDQKNNHD